MKRTRFAFVVRASVALFTLAVALPRSLAQTNSWTSSGGGFWETAASWSRGVAPGSTNQTLIAITNATTKTITLDATDSGSYPATMTISNLLISAPVTSTNTLFLSNAGLTTPLRILNALDINAGGILRVDNSLVRVDGGALTCDGDILLQNGAITSSVQTVIGTTGSGSLTVQGGSFNQSGGMLTLGQNAGGTGLVLLTGGQLVVTNGTTSIGFGGVGSFTNTGGAFNAQDVYVGDAAGSRGTLVISGGTNLFSSILMVGNSSGATGTVLVSGGQLVTTNGSTTIGSSGVGSMTLTGGVWQAGSVYVGYNGTAQGTLTLAGGSWQANNVDVGVGSSGSGAQGVLWITGGTNLVKSSFGVGDFTGATGTTWMTGGSLVTTSAWAYIGSSSVGQMTVSGGAWRGGALTIGNWGGSRGTLTVAGGNTTLDGDLEVGNSANATGAVWLTSGQLVTTNGSTYIGSSGVGSMTVSGGVWQAGSVWVASDSTAQGTLTLAGGTVSVDNLIATNAGSGFNFNSGSLTTEAATINTPGNLVVGDTGGAATWIMNGGQHTIFDALMLGNAAGSTGAIWLTGGQLVVTNDTTSIGSLGVGSFTNSGGAFSARDVMVGTSSGSRGSLVVSGGTNLFSSWFTVGFDPGAAGSVLVSGGQLVVTNQATSIGFSGVGSFTNSGGTFKAEAVCVGSGGDSLGSLVISGGTNLFSSTLNVGYLHGAAGSVLVSGGELVVTNNSTAIGYGGIGSFTNSGGTFRAGDVYVGLEGASRGSLVISGGTNLFSYTLDVGDNAGATGSVVISDGQLVVTNASTTIGVFGVGSFTNSGGTFKAEVVYVGHGGGSLGSLVISGGTNLFSSALRVSAGTGATGSVVISDGQLVVTNASTTIGESGVGSFINSGGTFKAGDVFVGLEGDSRGSLVISGGTNLFSSALTVGTSLGATGSVLVSGGQLVVTNDTTTIGNSGVGSFTNSGGAFNAANVMVGAFQGSLGSLVVSGGTNLFFSTLGVGYGSGATGTVLLTGGQLVTTNGTTTLGESGAGLLSVGGGTAQFQDLTVGNASTASGTVTQTLGSVSARNLTLANAAGAAASYVMQGGTLGVTNAQVNSGGSFALQGGTVTVVGMTLNSGGALTQSGGTISGIVVTNLGAFTYNSGTFNARLVQNGTVVFNANFTAGDGMANFGDLAVTNGTILTLNGQGLDNEGTIALANGTLTGSGPLANNSSISGYGTISGSGGFVNNAQLTQSGGNLTLANTGVNANYGNLDLLSGYQFRLNGANLTNAGTLNLNGATVAGSATLVNDAGGTIYGKGTLSARLDNPSGLILMDAAGTLNLGQAINNGGVIELLHAGANFRAAGITNTGTIQGIGTVGTNLVNQGIVKAVGGTLFLSGAVRNEAGGLLTAGAGNEILAISGLSTNLGVISLSGGTFDNNGKALANRNQITGYGAFRSGNLVNSSNVTLSGGNSTVNGNVLNQGGGKIQVSYATAVFTGNVTNQGTIKATGAHLTFAGSYYENGTYISDPSTNSYADYTAGPNAALVGGAGDLWQFSGNFYNASTQNVAWSTHEAGFAFLGTSSHILELPGLNLGQSTAGFADNFAWGSFELPTGAALVLQDGNTNAGAAMYVHRFALGGGTNQIASITGNGLSIFYDAADAGNSYLGGQTYGLAGGGILAPVPEPGTCLLLLAGVAMMWRAATRRARSV